MICGLVYAGCRAFNALPCISARFGRMSGIDNARCAHHRNQRPDPAEPGRWTYMVVSLLREVRIGYRLVWCFGLILALMIGMAAVAMFAGHRPRQELGTVMAESSSKLAYVSEMRQHQYREGMFGRRLGLAIGFDEAVEDMRSLDLERAAYERAMLSFSTLPLSERERAIVLETRQYAERVTPHMVRARELVFAFNPRQASLILAREVAPVQGEWLQALDRLIDVQNTAIREHLDAFDAASRRTDRAIAAITIVAVVLAAVVAWALTRSITAPLGQAVELAQAVAGGELDQRLPPASPDEPGQLLAALGHMMSSVRDARDSMARLAQVDGLTGAYNRRHFDATLDVNFSLSPRSGNGACLSLLLIDVDHFKAYNDRFGHQAGDECLRRIVQAISGANLRPTDLVARYGGEEFAVVLPGCTARGAMQVGERIRLAVQQLQMPSAKTETSPWVTVSVGAASVTVPSATTPADLVRLADAALYEAKRVGRNRVQAPLNAAA